MAMMGGRNLSRIVPGDRAVSRLAAGQPSSMLSGCNPVRVPRATGHLKMKHPDGNLGAGWLRQVCDEASAEIR